MLKREFNIDLYKKQNYNYLESHTQKCIWWKELATLTRSFAYRCVAKILKILNVNKIIM